MEKEALTPQQDSVLACFQAQFHYSWVPGRRRLYHHKTGMVYVSDRERREYYERGQREFEQQTESILGVPDVIRWEEERIAPHSRRFAHTLLSLFDDLPHDTEGSRNWALLAEIVNDPFTALVLQSDPGPLPHATSRALFMCALTTAPEVEEKAGITRRPSLDSIESFDSEEEGSDSGHESDDFDELSKISEVDEEAEAEAEAEAEEGDNQGEDLEPLPVPVAVAVDLEGSDSSDYDSDDDADPLVQHAVWPSTPSLTLSVSPSSPTMGPTSPVSPTTPALCLSPPMTNSTLLSTLTSPSTATLTLYTSDSLTPSLTPLSASFGNLSVVSLADTLSPTTESFPKIPEPEEPPKAKSKRHSAASGASGASKASGASGASKVSRASRVSRNSAKSGFSATSGTSGKSGYSVKRDSWASWGSGSSADSGLGCVKDLAVTEFRNSVSSVPDYGLLLAALTRVITLAPTPCLPTICPGPHLLSSTVSMPELLAENRSRPRADWPQLEGIWCGLVPNANTRMPIEKDLPGYFRLEPCTESKARECLDLSRLPIPDPGNLPNMFFTGQVLDQKLMPRQGARLAGVAAMSPDGAVSVTFRFMRVSEGDVVRFPDDGLVVRATRVGLESPMGFLGVSVDGGVTQNCADDQSFSKTSNVRRQGNAWRFKHEDFAWVFPFQGEDTGSKPCPVRMMP